MSVRPFNTTPLIHQPPVFIQQSEWKGDGLRNKESMRKSDVRWEREMRNGEMRYHKCVRSYWQRCLSTELAFLWCEMTTWAICATETQQTMTNTTQHDKMGAKLPNAIWRCNASLFTPSKVNGKLAVKINFSGFLQTEGGVWVRVSEGKQRPALVRLHSVDRQAGWVDLSNPLQAGRHCRKESQWTKTSEVHRQYL